MNNLRSKIKRVSRKVGREIGRKCAGIVSLRSQSSLIHGLALGLMSVLLLTLSFVSFGQAAQKAVIPQELVEKALTQGTVRVIVRLGVGFVPEGLLVAPVAVVDQRQDIAMVQNNIIAALVGMSQQVVHKYETVPFLALEVDLDALGVLEALASRGLVVKIEEDKLVAPTLAESTPLVEANQAWLTGSDGTGRVIAILDTGVDKNHPFLSGKVIEEACYSSNGSCPNGLTSQIGSGSGVPCTFAPLGCRHGSHVAGIAAGSGTSFSGVARNANLMSVQVFSASTSCRSWEENPCPRAFTSDLIAGLERVFTLRSTHNFASVNMSIGGGQYFSNCDSESIKPAIDNLRSVGIATVISSGNNGFSNALSYPACVSTAVSVGSTDDGSLGTTANRISSFSNSASFLSLLAPGQWINSSIPGGSFEDFQGTSMAAPHVAGTWAVLKQAKPTASVTEILTALQNTGLPVTDSRNGITKPRIRVFQALQMLNGSVAKCAGLTATIVGTQGDDVIDGTAGPDIINGLGGNDTIRGLLGNDIICGGKGNDIINGGKGKDTINGDNGRDILKGDNDADKLNGGGGTDSCDGGIGRDTSTGCEIRISIP